MRIFKLSIALFTAAFFLFSCSGPSPAVVNTPVNAPANTIANKGPSPESPLSLRPMDGTGDLAEARKTYKEVCINCHMENGEGGQIVVEGKSVKSPNFKRGGIVNAPDADLTKMITNGGEDMPGFGKRLSAQQINDLVRMIRSDFQSK